jgi:hypothetical protein
MMLLVHHKKVFGAVILDHHFREGYLSYQGKLQFRGATLLYKIIEFNHTLIKTMLRSLYQLMLRSQYQLMLRSLYHVFRGKLLIKVCHCYFGRARAGGTVR